MHLDDRNYDNDDVDYKSFTQLAYRTLMKNKAPVLYNLHLDLGPKCDTVDVGIWIETAVSRRVRWLIVQIRSGSSVSLPSSLFTCETIGELVLVHCLVPDVPCCLPFLKSLRLVKMGYACLHKILRGCPYLQNLKMCVNEEEHEGEDTTIALPCLRHLSLWDMMRYKSKSGVFVIEAPRLKYLKIIDDVVYDSRRIENMPNLTEAYVDITQGVTHKFLRALVSARRLYLCVPLLSEVPSMIIYFYRLVHLNLNICAQGWWELLTQMLQNSPKLVSLKLTDEQQYPTDETPDCWKRPSSIPDSLETFAWSGYKGRRGDLEMATFIMKNATRLKTATFLPQCNDTDAKYKMLKDLVSVTTTSNSCQLLFD
ncbi:F-box/FBD/LRR-repeat protein At4g26340 [Arabidopsis lyrata subsp. lyrata]|uniref:F-box/FBD/LRR-repeat protein At4g26340 n=1 Tax=Arabidopsis lyrata subsp. lyrata TaxID=81972 RepID=UPI000A29C353|nr:F-box/FBD/LRR-repeat protein At4g26340 [Arabidopsis lyrata subsp. lyrata]|eukprot:XP_020871486.1 F-box/FBD/LRR-repeat protein At4g26340 [Arabidopsis lyrata subsp. lyrata]